MAFRTLEAKTARTAFTEREILEEAPSVNPKTLIYHLGSTMGDGKYHTFPGTMEVESIKEPNKLKLFALTKKGRMAVATLVEGGLS